MKLIKILKLLETKKSFNKRKKIWTKITKRKISINEAKNLYKELMQKDFDELKKEKSSTKKNNILKPLKCKKYKCNIYSYLFALRNVA